MLLISDLLMTPAVKCFLQHIPVFADRVAKRVQAMFGRFHSRDAKAAYATQFIRGDQ